MTALAAVLAVALVVQTVRLRAALAEGNVARDVAVSSLLFAVAASAEAQRRRVDLGTLAARALALEAETIAINQRELDARGRVSDGGLMLTGAAYRLCADIEAARGGE